MPGPDGVIEYVVTRNSSLRYIVTPFGPNDPVHHGAFAIDVSGTISGRTHVRAPESVWVQIQARYVVWGGAGFSEVEIKAVSSLVEVTDTWQEIEVFVDAADVPNGASHFFFDHALSGDAAGAAPTIGTTLWVDQVWVSDSGVDLSGHSFVDGDQPGCFWEGEPDNSTSRTDIVGDTDPTDPGSNDEPGIDEDVTDDDPTGDGGIDEPDIPPDPDAGNPDSPPDTPPTVDDIAIGDEAAERTVGHRTTPHGLCLDSDIQLGDFMFNEMDDFGTVWIVSEIENWWNLPEPDVPDVEKGFDDGSYETRGRYRARVINLTGSFFPNAPSDVPLARARLIQAINLCHVGSYFMTHEPDFTRGSKVWLSGQPQISTTNTSGRTDFTIGLKAPDPIKYGLKGRLPPGYESIKMIGKSDSYPGRSFDRTYPWGYPAAIFGASEGTANNYGNIDVYPILTVKGPTYGNVTIHNTTTSQDMTVIRPLAADEVLRIDCGTKQLTLNGASNQRWYLGIDVDWIKITPGGNRFFFTEDEVSSDRAELTVSWRSGWIG